MRGFIGGYLGGKALDYAVDHFDDFIDWQEERTQRLADHMREVREAGDINGYPE